MVSKWLFCGYRENRKMRDEWQFQLNLLFSTCLVMGLATLTIVLAVIFWVLASSWFTP